MANLGRFVRASFKPTGFDIGKGRDIFGIRWQGLDKVLENLNKEIDKIEGRTVKRMLQVGLLVKRESQKITPVHTGNLKGSAYVIWGGRGKKVKAKLDGKFQTGKSKSADRVASEYNSIVANRKNINITQQPFAEIGYTAFYAVFVHENLQASHVKKGRAKLFGKRTIQNVQIGQAKFLEQALFQNSRRILNIIKEDTKIK